MVSNVQRYWNFCWKKYNVLSEPISLGSICTTRTVVTGHKDFKMKTVIPLRNVQNEVTQGNFLTTGA